MAGRPRKQRNNKTFIANKLEELIGEENFAEFERKNQLPITTVRRIMNGIDPRISTLTMIAKACNVTLDYFFEGGAPVKTHRPAEESRGNGSVGPDVFDPVDIVFSLQKSLSGFLSILADVGRHISAGQSLRGYDDLPELISTIRDVKGLCESISTSLEVYQQDNEGQDRTA